MSAGNRDIHATPLWQSMISIVARGVLVLLFLWALVVGQYLIYARYAGFLPCFELLSELNKQLIHILRNYPCPERLDDYFSSFGWAIQGWLQKMMLTNEVSQWLPPFENQLLIYSATLAFLMRGLVCILFMPVFIMLCVIGAVEGLVRRAHRRWHGGRESSARYYIGRRGVRYTIGISLLTYSFLPGCFAPLHVLWPGALTGAVFCALAVNYLKKYL